MRFLRTLALWAVAIAVLLSLPQEGTAQLPCGIWCASCGFMRSMGVDEDEDHGMYEIQCESFASCEELDCGELVTANHPSSQSLLNSLGTASDVQVAWLVSLHRERLLLERDRSMIVILHRTRCAPEELAENIQAVAFLPPDRAELLDRLGVLHLEAFASRVALSDGPPQD